MLGDNTGVTGVRIKRVSETLQVREGRAQFEVNLSDYLDTGLFLDHRPVRSLLVCQEGGTRLEEVFVPVRGKRLEALCWADLFARTCRRAQTRSGCLSIGGQPSGCGAARLCGG